MSFFYQKTGRSARIFVHVTSPVAVERLYSLAARLSGRSTWYLTDYFLDRRFSVPPS
jgi:hypothetical protein